MGFQGLVQFANVLKRARDASVNNAGIFIRKIALEAYTGITKLNPVDTGRSRANWQITVDNPQISEIDGPDDKGFWTSEFQKKQTEARQRIDSLRGGNALGRIIFIGNTVDYIFQLEGGRSQRGGHMVKLTMERLNAKYGNI